MSEACHCGSGRKLKNCHASTRAQKSQRIINSEEFEKGLQQKIEEVKALQKLQQDQQGLGRPIISALFNEYRIVAVGKTRHWSKSWKTFHDFLLYYIRKALGEEWGNAEIKKPYEERHPILQWYDQVCTYQKTFIVTPGVVSSASIIGVVEVYLHLAYNLYLLAHNEELQKKLIDRLKLIESFPGALYEIYVYATLIKAGFDIDFLDESKAKSKCCECIATYRLTGRKYSVEAKSIRREGALGAIHNTTNKDLEGSVRDQLYKGLCKEAPYPRIIFIDMNLPALEQEKMPRWIEEAVAAVKIAETKLTIQKQPPDSAYVFLTNHPHHYHANETNYGRSAVGIGFKMADFGHGKAYESLSAMYFAKKKHSDIHRLLNSIKVHYDIPSTFDSEPSEFYFGDTKNPRLKIGRRYLIDQNGTVGELTTAIVSEREKKIIGAFYIKELNRSIMATYPISDEDLATYKRHPDTFFGVVLPVSRNTNDPFELFEWMLESYKNTPREKLLELMKDHSNTEVLHSLSKEELAVAYCERVVYALMAKQTKKSTGEE